jgi:hypothetical protein
MMNRVARSRVEACMRFLPLVLLASAATAAAQPRPRLTPPVFDRTTSFQSCQNVTSFACGMIDDNGMRYGTAHTRTLCTRYTFLPNGTFTSTSVIPERGVYTIRGAKVTLTLISDDLDAKPTSFDLMLSNDGEKLGDMVRQLQ